MNFSQASFKYAKTANFKIIIRLNFRLLDSTFTLEEVEDILSDISNEVSVTV